MEFKEQIYSSESPLSVEMSFDIANHITSLVLTDKLEAHKLIIYILDNWHKIPTETHKLWTDIIEIVGFYPYVEKQNLDLNNFAGELRKARHLSKSISGRKVYFHEKQKELDEYIKSGKNIIVSAPTSFGKSLLIEEIVASKKYQNILIIQPTLALLDETRKKLRQYSERYKIILRTSQEPSDDKGNIFLFTSERVLEYHEFPQIDFLVLDEFYKLSLTRDDERAEHLNNAFYTILKKHNPQYYLLGPNIEEISSGFKEKYNAEFLSYDYKLIETEEIDLSNTKDEEKEKVLFDKLLKFKNGQNIIYCSSPNRVMELSNKFHKYLLQNKIIEEINIPLIEWAKNNIDKNWFLIRILSSGIGIHNGVMPKHINTSIIDYFNTKKINYLFCTSTIIEGVNTTAKNVFVFDKTRGNNKQIDFFDYSNIKGRAGRMMEHFIGNVFHFHPTPEKKETKVDIPFFEQNEQSFTKEIEIAMDDVDIKDKNREQYRQLKALNDDERSLLKQNGLSVDGQLELLKLLTDAVKSKNELYGWSGAPTYEQLKNILNIGWKYLLKKGESRNGMNPNYLTLLVWEYARGKTFKSLQEKIQTQLLEKKLAMDSSEGVKAIKIQEEYKKLKKSDKKQFREEHKDEFTHLKYYQDYQNKSDDDILQESIVTTFQILRHWIQYKIPKWLNVINNIQQYVAIKQGIKSGEYSWFASQLENDFVASNLSILKEYGVPKSAVNKISKHIDDNVNEEDVLQMIKRMAKNSKGMFDLYELQHIDEI
ncbi:MAG: hypothetical protein KU37_10920 [Sulfuricurvum sp. PC08-66]|nr:MAG: hypothetical protein KU37_10920 [Sulfuricurvum sp. PC08-66]